MRAVRFLLVLIDVERRLHFMTKLLVWVSVRAVRFLLVLIDVERRLHFMTQLFVWVFVRACMCIIGRCLSIRAPSVARGLPCLPLQLIHRLFTATGRHTFSNSCCLNSISSFMDCMLFSASTRATISASSLPCAVSAVLFASAASFSASLLARRRATASRWEACSSLSFLDSSCWRARNCLCASQRASFSACSLQLANQIVVQERLGERVISSNLQKLTPTLNT